jgi:hypothetical protein
MFMDYLVTQNGQEIYRADALPVLREGEQWFALEPDESTEDLQARIAAGQQHTAATGAAALQADIVLAVQHHLDGFAQTRGYDGILSACTYAASAVSNFAAEGQYCVAARDAAWSTCYQIVAEVLAGTRPAPTVAEVLAELPALAWP